MKLFQLIHLLLQLNAFVFLFQTVTSVLFLLSLKIRSLQRKK